MTRLAVDFGARFADFCLVTPDGLRVVKQPLEDGPDAALRAGLAALGVTAADLDEIRIATTRPLNALLAQDPAPIALLTTAGFGDVLELARQDRVDLYAPVARSAAPLFLAPRERVFEIGGRIGPDGAETEPLDSDSLDRAVAALRAAGVSGVAVSLLFAHVNPAHELAVAERLVAEGFAVSLSHRVDPAPREYERSVATLLDAWLQAGALGELSAMAETLRAEDFNSHLHFGDGRGVVRDAEHALADPTTVLASGPAAAARGAVAAVGADAIVLDLGSRSADFMLLREAAPAMADPGGIAGIPLRRDLVDVSSLPLGGACRVAVAGGRLLLDDPQAPRLDDVLAAAGRLPDGDDAAPDVLPAVAAYLGEAAIRFATRRNLDPARAELVVSGGTGGLLAADIATAMGLTRVALPLHPAASGAAGLALAPERIEARRAVNRSLADLTDAEVVALFDALDAAFAQAGGTASPETYRLSLAPRPEMHPMALALSGRPDTAGAILTAYRDAYAARYEIDPPGPGYLGSVMAIRDVAPETPTAGSAADTVQDGPALAPTEAGAVWVPEGWRLTTTATVRLLEVAP